MSKIVRVVTNVVRTSEYRFEDKIALVMTLKFEVGVFSRAHARLLNIPHQDTCTHHMEDITGTLL